MVFWLQKEDEDEDIDIRILKEELNKQRYNHTYNLASANNYYHVLDIEGADRFKQVIPVGMIDFVQHFLQKVYNVSTMNPIEVPDILREKRFLKRNYSIVPLEELPKSGYYFAKYVSKLKVFSHTGLIDTLWEPDISIGDGNRTFLLPGLYQVSEVVDILSEYRCFVHNDKLLAMNYYDGDCTVLPDVETIQSMIGNYVRDSSRPKAYTMDIAVIKDRGTAILEVHPWVSVGLYGYIFGSSLPYCYRDGFEYYIDSNKELNCWSNF